VVVVVVELVVGSLATQAQTGQPPRL
jgi:hypothetical protein